MSSDNSFKIFSQQDIDEIDNVIEFASGLILKDMEIADESENKESYQRSAEYLSAVLLLQDAPEDPDIRQAIIDNYEEHNKYYKQLNVDYAVPYHESRMAKHMHIIYTKYDVLSRDDRALFYECYYESLNYYNRVISTNAFNNQTMNKGFIKLFVVYSAIQKYLNRKMEVFFDIDKYSARDLKNAFISAGLDYFEDMPTNYQRRLLKMIGTLLEYKGTNFAIEKTLELFGFKNIEIFKYVLVKSYHKDKKNGRNDYDNPFLFFIKTQADSEVNFAKDIQLNYDSITGGDPYWHASPEEILQEEFNMITTKYLSVDTTIDAMRESIGLSYFMNLLKRFQTEYKEKEGIDFGFLNRDISETTIHIFDAIVALQALIVRYHGYVDTITINPDVVNYVYGYHDIENKISIEALFSEIEDILRKESHTVNNVEDIQDFIKAFKMEGFEDKSKVSIEHFLEVYNKNEAVRFQLENLIQKTENYNIYRILNRIWDMKMQTRINIKVYKGHKTYTDYLLNENYDLFTFLSIPESIKGNKKQERAFYRDRIFQLTESISNYISDLNVRQFFINNSYIGLTSSIEKYMYTIISLFKSYTIDLLSANIILNFANKTFNTVRLFDDFRSQSEQEFVERVDLLDILNIHDVKNTIAEHLDITDEMIIHGNLYPDADALELYDNYVLQTGLNYNEGIEFKEGILRTVSIDLPDYLNITDTVNIEVQPPDLESILELNDAFTAESNLGFNEGISLKDSITITVETE